ncbi:MAG TPA: Rrf2 family transcriptional regulator [Terracidiphilus sp.]|jgi:Rrf2 family protein|nr:Rrf2 family transcriptional regulator [Terracidiphilus sp.]
MKNCNSSMQLTRAADYAVRVMVHLVAQPSGRRLSLPSIAAATGAPESFLSKVLQTLARARLILSQRGQAGGFEIAPRGRQATMLEVIEAVDGPIRLNVCLTSGKSCARKLWCPAHPVWLRAQQAMLEVLEEARVVELAEFAAMSHAPLPPALFPLSIDPSPAAVEPPQAKVC